MRSRIFSFQFPVFLILLFFGGIFAPNGLTELEKDLELELENIENANKQLIEHGQYYKELEALLGNIQELAALSSRELPVMEVLFIGPLLAYSPKRYLTDSDGKNVGAEMAQKFWNGPSLGQFIGSNSLGHLPHQIEGIKLKMDSLVVKVDGQEVGGLLQVLEKFRKKLDVQLERTIRAIHPPLDIVQIIRHKFGKKGAETSNDPRLLAEVDQITTEELVVGEMLEIYSRIHDLVVVIQKEVQRKGTPFWHNLRDENILETIEKRLKYETLKKCVKEASEMEKAAIIIFSNAQHEEEHLERLEIAYLKVKAGLARIGLENGINEAQADELLFRGAEGAERVYGQLRLRGKGEEEEMPKADATGVNKMETKVLTAIGRLIKTYFVIREEIAQERARELEEKWIKERAERGGGTIR